MIQTNYPGGSMSVVRGGSKKVVIDIIVTKDEHVFCYKSDLPDDVKDGDKVTFDAIPSFDKKKNTESWKASNIQPVDNSS